MKDTELKDLAIRLIETKEQVLQVAVTDKTTRISRVDIKLVVDSSTYDITNGRLVAIVEKIIKEKSSEIVKEAKERLLKQYQDQELELKRASLEYATGFEITNLVKE